jgi:hypothetical protein
MSTSVAQVAAHIATSIFIVAAAVFASAVVAFVVARRHGGPFDLRGRRKENPPKRAYPRNRA